jgi:hypothetical protein
MPSPMRLIGHKTMSANGTRSIIWLNGEDQFCLAKVGLLLDLEDKCRAGIGTIFGRLESGHYFVNDVRETIRLGLIGGGMSAEKAMAAVKNHVDGRPLALSVLIAHAVIEAVLIGVPDDPVGKDMPAEAKPTGSFTQTDASDAPKLSPSAPPSPGRRASRKSTRSGSSSPPSTDTTAPTAART